LFYVIASTASYVLGRDMTWKWLQDNWSELEKRYGEAGGHIPRIIGYTVNGFTTEERANEVETFFANHPVAIAERTIKQSLETIRSTAKWLNRDRVGVAQWLNRYD